MYFISALFQIRALPRADAESGSSQKQASFATVPPPTAAWGLGACCGGPGQVPALLRFPISNPRVLRSRGLLSQPRHLGCLFWTPATEQQNRTGVIAHLPRLAPLQQSIGATAALRPICTPQGSRDFREALQPILYSDPDLTGSPVLSHGS